MRSAIPAALLGVSLLLVASIAYEAMAPAEPQAVDVATFKSRPARVADVAAYAPPPIELFADIDAHPLFSAARKPLPDLVQTGAAAASSDFSLVGVIMSGTRAVALLRTASTSSTASAALGDTVNGWRVARIDATSIVLRANGSEVTVSLADPASQPASAPLQPLQVTQPVEAPTPAATPSAATATAPAQANRPAAATPPAVAANTPRPGVAPGHKPDATIAPDALKGATFDPKTGEPTL